MTFEVSLDWPDLLKQYRRERRLTQLEVARRAGLSVAAVRSYEHGKRHPKVATLQSIIDGLGLSGEEAARLYEAAGFSARQRPAVGDYGPVSIDDLRDEMSARPWPAFVTNQAFEVVAQNKLFERVMAVDLDTQFTEFGDRTMLAGIVIQEYGGRMENWDEVVTFMIGLVKGDPRGSEDDDRPLPWLEGPIQRLVEGKPELIRRFVELWESVPPLPRRLRHPYRMQWRYDADTLLSFHCTLALADPHTELHYNEWVPANAKTWTWVEENAASISER
jgi:transcriptional regulator with XRE-family HTH domain